MYLERGETLAGQELGDPSKVQVAHHTHDLETLEAILGEGQSQPRQYNAVGCMLHMLLWVPTFRRGHSAIN